MLATYFSSDEWQKQAPVGQTSSLKAGGAAEFLFCPKTTEHLAQFFQLLPESGLVLSQMPVMGATTNILVRDGGIPGVTISLKNIDEAIVQDTSGLLICPSGVLNWQACQSAMQSGLSGLEFLIGIPGSIGGAVYMNAGAHGCEIKDILAWIEVMDHSGKVERIARNQLPMTYRHGGIPHHAIILRAAFALQKENPAVIQTRQQAYLRERNQKIRLSPHIGTAGSAFKNPPGEKRAWEWITQVGGRGMQLGQAIFSNEHANFLLNLGGAMARDLENLGEKVRDLVYNEAGIKLEWEIQIIGEKGEEDDNQYGDA